MPYAMTRRFTLCVGFLAAQPRPASVAAVRALKEPDGKVILTIEGRISRTNGEGAARFDLAMIEALQRTSFTTTTPWHDGPQTFEGVLVRALLHGVGAEGSKLTVRALNNYVTEVPFSDSEEHDAILAYKRNGEYMPVRDKGPLFVVYPYSSKSSLQNEIYYGRSAWQVNRISVD
jgi:hypothetical protein